MEYDLIIFWHHCVGRHNAHSGLDGGILLLLGALIEQQCQERLNCHRNHQINTVDNFILFDKNERKKNHLFYILSTVCDFITLH